MLIGADVVLAYSNEWTWVWLGVSLWGLHMGITQGLLATMVADAAPEDLRGTAFGFFNLVSGVALMASALAGLLWDQFGAPDVYRRRSVQRNCMLAILVHPPRQPPRTPA